MTLILIYSFGNTWTAFYVDKFGRRSLLLIGAIGTLVTAIFLCALTAEYIGTTHKAGLKAAVFFCFLYIFWWCFFIDATQYVYVLRTYSGRNTLTDFDSYIAEIYPNHLRSAGVAFGLASFYLASEVTLVAAPIAMDNIGWKFYLVLICPSFVYVWIIYFLFPETKGRTLEEIGALFGDANVANRWYGLT